MTPEAVKVLQAAEALSGTTFRFQTGLIGGCTLDAIAAPLPAATISICNNSQAALLGAVGGPKWDVVRPDLRPGQGLLQLRERLGLYVNLRPARALDSLVGTSAVKPDRVRGTNIVIVRELTGGTIGDKCTIGFFGTSIFTHFYWRPRRRRSSCKVTVGSAK